MHAAFAAKLRLTAAALGCTSRKAFCARFRAVNPATNCDIDRLHKWMQGKALPRGPHFYEDWRMVIGSQRHATWIEASSVDAFAEELAQATGMTLQELRLLDGRGQTRQNDTPAVLGAQRTVYGAFICYSHAWSPSFQGKLIRGSLRVAPRTSAALQASYSEAIISGSIRLSGDVIMAGGMMHVLLREGTGSPPLFLSLIAPGPPASVLCGVLAGSALVAHAALPSASRFVAVKVPEGTALEPGNRYIEPDPATIMDDLASAGLRIPEADRAVAALLSFLGAAADQVTLVHQLALCDLLDAAHLPAESHHD